MARSLARSIVRPLPAAITGLSGGGGGDAYAANGISPDLAVDFNGSLNSGTPLYRKQGSTTTLDAFSFPEPDGLRTMTDSGGNIVWNAHNLAINSETPATQSITVVSGVEYTVEMEGAGSFALTGAGTGTASDGSPATVTASSTTLTITLTGAADRVWVYRSDLGGMSDVESSYRTAGAPANYLATTGTARYLPRFGDHAYSGSAWVDKGTLVEREARTNRFDYSNDFTQSTWTKTSSSVTAAAATGPDGNTSMSKIVENSSTASHQIRDATTATGDSCVSAVVGDAGDSRFVLLHLYVGNQDWEVVAFDPSDGSVTQASSGSSSSFSSVGYGAIPVEAGRYRLWLAGTSAGAVQSWVGLSDTGTPTLTSFGEASYAGDGTSGVYVGFAQNEAALTPSSYIPTNGTATARTADSALTTAAADAPYSASGLSLAVIGEVTYADEGSAAQLTFAERETDANNYSSIDVDTDSAATGEINANQAASGTLDTATGATQLSPGVGVAFGIATRHTAGVVQAATLGSAGTANTSPTALANFSSTDLDIASDNFMGTISRIVGWAEDIGVGIEQASTEDNTAP